MNGRVVTRCNRCGARMEPGERVRMTLSWEVGFEGVRDGSFVSQPETRSKCAVLCRACAIEASRQFGVSAPWEAFVGNWEGLSGRAENS